MLVSLIIVSLNGEKVLPRCLESIGKLDWAREQLEVVIINNGSSDSTRQIIDEFADKNKSHGPHIVPIHVPENLGFAGGNNEGIRRARGEWVVLLNDDTELDPSWLRVLMNCAARFPRAGILGSLLLYPDGTVQHAGAYVLPSGNTGHFGVWQPLAPVHEVERHCDYVTGAVFAIRRDVIDRIGLLDHNYWPIYFEECDFCFRARAAGFAVVSTPALAIHHESQLMGVMSERFLRNYHRNRLRFVWINFSWRQRLHWILEELDFLWNQRRKIPWRIYFKTYAFALWHLPGWVWGRRNHQKIVPP